MGGGAGGDVETFPHRLREPQHHQKFSQQVKTFAQIEFPACDLTAAPASLHEKDGIQQVGTPARLATSARERDFDRQGHLEHFVWRGEGIGNAERE